MSRGRRHVARAIAAVLLAVAVSGCATSKNYRKGEELAREGDWDTAVAYFTKALQDNPDRPDYKISLERAMLKAAQVHMTAARAFDQKGDTGERAARVPQGARVRAQRVARDHAARRARTAGARAGRGESAGRQDRSRCASGRGARPKARS